MAVQENLVASVYVNVLAIFFSEVIDQMFLTVLGAVQCSLCPQL